MLYSYRIKPDKLLDNNKLSDMFKDLHNYKTIWDRKKWPEDDLLPSLTSNQIGWEIKVTRNNAYFYFTTTNPSDVDIIKRSLPTSTINEELLSLDEVRDNIDIFLSNELELNHHYFMSLSTDRVEFEPIASILSVQKILNDNEYVVVQNIFRPDSADWSIGCVDAYDKFKNGIMPNQLRINKKDIGMNLLKGVAMIGLGIGETIQSLLLDDNDKVEKFTITDNGVARILKDAPLSKSTMNKPKHSAYNTTIRIVVKSDKKEKREQLLRGVNTSFNTAREDNYLIPKAIDLNIKYADKIINRIASNNLVKNILSTEEVTKLCLLPQIVLQNSYNMDCIETREVDIPRVILNNKIPIGRAYKNGKVYDVGWELDRNIITSPKIVVGGMGCGKTKFTASFVNGVQRVGHGAFVFDFIGNCKLAKDIETKTPSNKLVTIDISDIKNPFSLSYSEVKITDDMDRWSKIKNASEIAEQTAYLINALNDGSAQPLTSSMSKTLFSACMLTYVTGRTKIYDVIQFLQNHKFRREIINEVVKKEIYKINDVKMTEVLDLDELSTKGITIGTKYHKIEYIMDRIDVLLRNPYLEVMTMTDIDKHNFIDYMNDGKIVLIKIPEHTFKKKWVKDVVITYFLSRIWMCALMRGDESSNRICHIVTDEIHQIPTAGKLVADTVTESRKFSIGYFFTCQYLKQFKVLLDGVNGAGASYMLLAGTEKENYRLLKEECGDFTLQDVLTLKEFTSLNIIKTSIGTVNFISHLPRPLIM